MLIFFGGFEQIIAQGISLLTTIPTALTAAATKIRKENNLLNWFNSWNIWCIRFSNWR